MKTAITGFHQDEASHWVAELACGHTRHFRHHPPWQNREWVTSPFPASTSMRPSIQLKIRILIIKKRFQQFFGATLDGLPVTQEQIIKITGFKNF